MCYVTDVFLGSWAKFTEQLNSYFNELFLMCGSRSQQSTQLVVFFKPLMLMLTKGHAYLTNLEVLVEGLRKGV